MREDYRPDDEEEDRPLDEVQPVAEAGSVLIGRPVGLRYFEMYRYVFDSPHWGMNLLAGAICQLVPAVGPLVFIGYGYDVVEALHRRGGRRYPDFDTGRLIPYLMRGLWPFLVALIVALPMMLVILVGMFLAFAVAGSSRDSSILLVVVPILVVVVLGLSIVLQLLVTPLMLRAGLQQELDFSNALEFVREFLRRTWKETLLGALFLMFTGLVVELLGLLLCYIGIYPAVALIILANQHLLYQLYQIYLARGGAPIPLKRESPRPEHFL